MTLQCLVGGKMKLLNTKLSSHVKVVKADSASEGAKVRAIPPENGQGNLG